MPASLRHQNHIPSNGTLIDETTASRMVETGVMAIVISTDGADAQTNDSFPGTRKIGNVRAERA
jgi:MoaA/NifB/PqqE/SkfB family radical SAM enzyme